ncbi:diaminopimelate decarboxylase [Hufsiella ginkgonis]|uniref:Diaminopimelate decarboxylase n=1 Tax=Hufsiella ginkgonis TaxID=2695274 RepID=A0A7K1XVW9_9SPHI|nr:diaminopimelate decarboxylase [Hufsiella ginkgonis]MXV15120.1 diaminopimelate decarboxylase [Hufsiella ginkgonis]
MFNHQDISRFESIETPFYYYDLDLLRRTLAACKMAADQYGFHVHYAMKANFNPRVLDAVRNSGIGADCVSGNEVKKAAEIGFDPGNIVFAGVGKSDREINDALGLDIFSFNVESIQELGVLNGLAAARNKIARVAIRINPNVDAHTHHNITTGLEENKFGINTWELAECVKELKQSPNLEFIGIHFHIGSQVTDLEVFKSLCLRVNDIRNWFEDHQLHIRVLNVGGGLGIDYHHPDEKAIVDFEAYFKVFDQFLERRHGQEVHFELGRALVAQCGNLVSRVLYVKNGQKKNFLVLDAGMTELIRPMLYQAYHQMENLSVLKLAGNERNTTRYDVVGPICESTDCFGKEVEMPVARRNDLIVIRSAGAYGEVMASGYNLRDRVTSVYSES